MFKERDNTKLSYIQTWNVGVDVGTVETAVINQAQRANIVSWTALKLQEQPSSHVNDWYGVALATAQTWVGNSSLPGPDLSLSFHLPW